MQPKGDVPVPLQALVSGNSTVPGEDGKCWFCQQRKGESEKGGLQMMKEQRHQDSWGDIRPTKYELAQPKLGGGGRCKRDCNMKAGSH